MPFSREPTHVGILDLHGCLLYAIDVNHLASDHDSAEALISGRVSGRWINDVATAFGNSAGFGFAPPRFARSAYGQTDRASRNTFTARHSRELLPLHLPVSHPVGHLVHDFHYWVEGVRVSPQGAISLRVLVSTGKSRLVPAKDVVHSYHELLARVPRILNDALQQFTSWWNSLATLPPLSLPDTARLQAAWHSYDVWDYDFCLVTSQGAHQVQSVKGLYSSDDPTPAQELTAIANMDIADVESLRDVRLEQFTGSDIGTRDDELWSIGHERMTRRHPERGVSYNKAFFLDVLLATEILVGHQSTLDFMEDWVAQQRRSLLNQILAYSDLSEVNRTDLRRRYADVIRASQILIEPLALERGVKHTFFATVVTRLSDVLGLNRQSRLSAQAMSDFAELVESISGFHDAEMSEKLGSIQVELAASTRRLGLLAAIITAVGVVVAVLSIILH